MNIPNEEAIRQKQIKLVIQHVKERPDPERVIIFGDFNSIPTNASVRKIAIHRLGCPYDRCGIRHDAQYYQKDHFDGQANATSKIRKQPAVTKIIMSLEIRERLGTTTSHRSAQPSSLRMKISRIHQGWLANASLIEVKVHRYVAARRRRYSGIPLGCPVSRQDGVTVPA